jgi:CubicO group peptidase (beta-lactamase class C family)
MAVRKHRHRPLATAAALLATLTPAAAQRVPPADNARYARAVAAGYKAAVTCSGVFEAGRTPAQIDAEELHGIYPEYDAIVPTLKATVFEQLTFVQVPWDDAMQPRIAIHAPGSGCTLLPIGTDPTGLFPIPEGMWRLTRPAGASPIAWPMGDAGIRPRPSRELATAVAHAFDGATYGAGHTTGVVVLRDGQVAAERYAAGWGPFTANRTWSAGKSIAGTLVGLAGVDPAQPATVPEWSQRGYADPRARITLDNLLRMASGLHSDTAGNRTDAIYFGGTAVTEQTTGWPLETKPGTRFRYANNDILLAVRALRATLGNDRYEAFPRTALFEPLGMRHTVAERDWRGNYIMSSQVWSTARDLARLGQFWLQDGVWEGKRMLPDGWVRYMTTPSGPQPAEGPGYGATTWLFGAKQGLPDGSYAAQGNRGQYVMVIPSAKLVVVRRGEDGGAARFDIARFAADVLAASR